jgi:hypothetical protein
MKGFSEKLCHWIDQFVSKDRAGVKVNDDIGQCFQTKKGLRQGDHLSPLLFNLVADMLALIITWYSNAPQEISNTDWKIIKEKFEKKLSSWKGKLLSYGGRLVLINSILSSLTMFMLSFYEVLKVVLHKLDFYRSEFFCKGITIKRNIG